MRLTISSEPSIEPVTVDEAKDHMRVDHESEDGYISSLIVAARLHAQMVTRRAFITQTWVYYLDTFPSEIQIYLPPLQSVSSITYVDVDGVTQTLGTSIYTVDTDSEPGLIYEAYNQSWPSIRTVEKSITITYVAGYGTTASTVPEGIRQAMLILISHWYENREPFIVGTSLAPVPLTIDALLAPYWVLSF